VAHSHVRVPIPDHWLVVTAQDAFDKQAEELGAMLKESQQWLADVEATESTK